MATLFANQPIDEPNLFSDLGDEALIPSPCAEYPLQSIYKSAERNWHCLLTSIPKL
jgi:hypothetical protein